MRFAFFLFLSPFLCLLIVLHHLSTNETILVLKARDAPPLRDKGLDFVDYSVAEEARLAILS